MTVWLLCILLHLTTIFASEISSNILPDSKTCGVQSTLVRIVGGTETALNEHPWMALLEYDTPKGRDFYCGGSLINNRYVLTAAHCIINVNKSWTLISVRLGEHDLGTKKDCVGAVSGLRECAEEPLDIEVEEKIVHEQYAPNTVTRYNDIALLRLNSAVTFSEWVQPICLPTSTKFQNITFVGVNMTVAGWGKTESSLFSNKKLKVELPLKSNDDCLFPNATLNENQLCVGGVAGKDSCTGDSGGPLMMLKETPTEENWYAVGVVSFGPTPCGGKWPSVYTKVAPYISWIQSHLKP